VPIFMGVQGPASLRLSGELADGTLLGWFSSPSYVAWARSLINEGRARVGRTDPHELVALCVLSMSDDDPDAAHHDVGDWATRNLAAMTEMPQLKVSPARADILAAIEQVQHNTSGRGLPIHLLQEFLAVGAATSCHATVNELLDAGADRVVLVPNPAGLRSTAAMLEQMQAATMLTAGPSEV
jgi:alkanesulfonate monooxygenase SsuD/methylene tetrahydromethanopterin reductase-like flavin-dependent oxidoreductase (luciferase family)